MNDHRRRERKAARRRSRRARGIRNRHDFKGGKRAAVDAGAAKLLGAIAKLAQPPVKGNARPHLIPVPCDCDPKVKHGMHWVEPRELPTDLREAA